MLNIFIFSYSKQKYIHLYKLNNKIFHHFLIYKFLTNMTLFNKKLKYYILKYYNL